LLKRLALDHGSFLANRHDSPQARRCSQYMVAPPWQRRGVSWRSILPHAAEKLEPLQGIMSGCDCPLRAKLAEKGLRHYPTAKPCADPGAPPAPCGQPRAAWGDGDCATGSKPERQVASGLGPGVCSKVAAPLAATGPLID